MPDELEKAQAIVIAHEMASVMPVSVISPSPKHDAGTPVACCAKSMAVMPRFSAVCMQSWISADDHFP